MTRPVTAPKKIWDNYKEIGYVRKSAAIRFVVAIAARDGIQYINIREFYKRKRDGVWKAGRDGITIPVEVPLHKGGDIIKPLESLIRGLTGAFKEFETFDLYDDEHAVWYMPKPKISEETADEQTVVDGA
jgi:hypothetical protein